MIRFNTGVVFTRQILACPTLSQTINVFNAPFGAVTRQYPALTDCINALASTVEKRRFISVSAHMTNFAALGRSCADTGWHTDGRMTTHEPDQYALVCFGADDLRTLFYQEKIEAEAPTHATQSIDEKRRIFQSILKHDLHDEGYGKEVGDGQIVRYSSLDFHKGRVARKGFRLMLRVMSSNFIRPKAKYLK